MRGLPSVKDRRRVHQAALRPQPVQAALDLERAVRLRDCVRTSRRSCRRSSRRVAPSSGLSRAWDRTRRPLPVPAEPRRVPRGLADLAHIVARDAVLLGGNQREEHPAHQRQPFVVAASHHRPEWFLRDAFRQDVEGLPGRRAQTRDGELRDVRGIGLATAGEKGVGHFGRGIDDEGFTLRPWAAK